MKTIPTMSAVAVASTFFVIPLSGWTQEASNMESFLQATEAGSHLIERGGFDSEKLRAGGKVAGGIAYFMSIDRANENLKRKWQTGEEATANDFVPYFLPLAGPDVNVFAVAVEHRSTIGGWIDATVKALDPRVPTPSYMQDWERWRQTEIDESEARQFSNDQAIRQKLQEMRNAPASVPEESNCEDMDWYASKCNRAPQDDSVQTPSYPASWKIVSIVRSDGLPVPFQDDARCIPYRSLDDMAQTYALGYGPTQYSGCVNQLTSVNDSNKVIAFNCSMAYAEPGATLSGTVEFFGNSQQIRVIRTETNTIGGPRTLIEETHFAPCQ